MNPGATVRPFASMTRAAAALPRRPMSTIRPARIPMSAESHGLPLPSMTRPFLMSTSYGGDCEETARVKVSNATTHRAMDDFISVMLRQTFQCATVGIAALSAVHVLEGFLLSSEG